MAFGQASGPPAHGKQLEELLALLRAAGHADFRDARGPMGFTQRQAGGKFTRGEADAFIDQLRNAAEETSGDAATEIEPVGGARPVSAPIPKRAATDRGSAAEQTLRRFPSGMLAAELQRRGWIVVEP